MRLQSLVVALCTIGLLGTSGVALASAPGAAPVGTLKAGKIRKADGTVVKGVKVKGPHGKTVTVKKTKAADGTVTKGVKVKKGDLVTKTKVTKGEDGKKVERKITVLKPAPVPR